MLAYEQGRFCEEGAWANPLRRGSFVSAECLGALVHLYLREGLIIIIITLLFFNRLFRREGGTQGCRVAGLQGPRVRAEVLC